jgi:hypothetical protein
VPRCPLDTLLGDAAYDAEAFHRLCREELAIRQSIFPLNSRGWRRPPQTRYRRQMYFRFPRGRYRQRWQVESVFSQFKRLLGSFLHAHSEQARYREVYLRILVFDLMLLLSSLRALFYRATCG